jgi:regulator of RNase E activity RraA
MSQNINSRFQQLSTPLIADACLRTKVPVRCAPPGIDPLVQGTLVAGPARPVCHFGSVDVFLEAMLDSNPGDVLVIDNAGRTDEGCIGDLTVLEARANKLAGIVLWGLHRDTTELLRIAFPVFTYGHCPSGPQRLDPRHASALQDARFGAHQITSTDFVFADDDGVLFVDGSQINKIVEVAEEIRNTERHQAEEIAGGNTLSEQLKLKDYLAERKKDPSFTFRKHLRRIGGAIEE